MHTSLSKKLLAGLLSLVMVLSLVAPGTSAQAAAKYSLTDKKSVKSGYTFKYELKGVSKGCYVKVTRNVSGEKVVYNKKELTKTTKVNGTGKTLNLYVTYGEKDENYTGKFTVRVYGKKTNKLYKTLVEEVTVKVPEKEEPEEPEKEAELVSVEATGAKKLTLTLSKEATVTAADVKVVKGNSTPNISSVDVDGTNVVVTLGSKMTAGTYSVTYKEVTKEVVVKDETLTTLEVVGTNLVADASVATTAAIGYRSLNQYGERMAAPGVVTATTTFGTANVTTNATAKKDGVITVTAIPTTLAVIGTQGSIVLVDNKTGVNSTTTITYAASATLSKVELLGMYDKESEKYKDIVAGEEIGDYVLVIKGYNQYGVEMDKDTMIADGSNIALTATPVLTNTTITGTSIIADNMTTVEIEGTEYAALKLEGVAGATYATAGSLNLTIVNKLKGILVSESFKIEDAVVVKSITINPKDTVYALDESEFDYEVLDQNGNAITSYAVLKALVTFTSSNGTFEWSKNKDGSAKLYYTANLTGYEGDTTTYRMSKPVTETVYGNAGTTNLVVNTLSFNVFAQRVPVEVTGYKGLTACASTGSYIEIAPSDIVVEDQYGNVMDTRKEVGLANIHYNITGSAFAAAQGTLDELYDSRYGYLYIDSPGTIGAATLYLGLDGDVESDISKATEDVKIVSVDEKKATGLYIDSVKYGYYVDETTASTAYTKAVTLTKSNVSVYGRVSGYTIAIPELMYDITGDTFKGFDQATLTARNGLSTETVEVSVYTEDGTVVLTSEYVRSNKPVELTYLSVYNTNVTGSAINATTLARTLYTKDQYGVSYATTNAKYDVTVKSVSSAAINTSNPVVVNKNNTASVTVAPKSGSFGAGDVIWLYVTVTLYGKVDSNLVKITIE